MERKFLKINFEVSLYVCIEDRLRLQLFEHKAKQNSVCNLVKRRRERIFPSNKIMHDLRYLDGKKEKKPSV